MKFWQSFSKSAIKRQFFFGLFLFAVMIPLAILDSNTQVKVSFNDISVFIKSDKYTMEIPYDIIESANLEDLAEPGERVQNSYDNDVLRAGIWENDTWGQYHIAADLDADKCIVAHLTDGRTFVFNSKNDEKTETIFAELQTYLD